MSKNQHIDNISEKVWKDYFSGVILTSDKERVEAFLKQYPEFEEEFKNVSKEDVASINRITKNINAKIDSKITKKVPPVLWWGAAVVVVIVGAFFFRDQTQPVETIAEHSVIHNSVSNTPENQISDTVKVIEKGNIIDDTMYSFEREGDEIKVEELIAEVSEAIYLENDVQDIELDTVFVLDKEVEKQVLQKEVYKKSFVTLVDYRQSIHVEDNFYSQSKTVGKTTAYASPVKGYTYEPEGMPYFSGSDSELLIHINERLIADELMKGNKRKMKANLSFVVTNKGKVKDILVQNCNHRQLGLSLMQIMENMPDWNPSEYKGKKGKVHYVLKIVFE